MTTNISQTLGPIVGILLPPARSMMKIMQIKHALQQMEMAIREETKITGRHVARGRFWRAWARQGPVRRFKRMGADLSFRTRSHSGAVSPGGVTDLLARLVGQSLSELLGQSVVIDNKPDGNCGVGSQVLGKAKQYGDTLLVMASTTGRSPSRMTRLVASAPIPPMPPVIKTLTPASLRRFFSSLIQNW